MVTRPQGELPFDKSLLRTIVRKADQNLGVYGVVAQAGNIAVGDRVERVS